ncbi:hypothetical protein LWX64_002600, partial [Enterococcus faecalis]|nr:hypothetical protein [Enterococcus faecalis]
MKKNKFMAFLVSSLCIINVLSSPFQAFANEKIGIENVQTQATNINLKPKKTITTSESDLPEKSKKTIDTSENRIQEEKLNVKINYENEQLINFQANEKYKINDREYTADESGKIALDNSWLGKTVSIVKVGTTNDSEAQELEIPPRLDIS